MMSDMASDADNWFEDDRVSFEDALARFDALEPEETVGPLSGGARLVRPSLTYGAPTFDLNPPVALRQVQLLPALG